VPLVNEGDHLRTEVAQWVLEAEMDKALGGRKKGDRTANRRGYRSGHY